MNRIEINKFSEIESLKDELLENKYLIDLNNCDIKEKEKILDFFAGLTFYNGFIKKINKNIFEIRRDDSYEKK